MGTLPRRRSWDLVQVLVNMGKRRRLGRSQLENYTAEAIVKIIHGEGLADAVDLVRGGHTTLS